MMKKGGCECPYPFILRLHFVLLHSPKMGRLVVMQLINYMQPFTFTGNPISPARMRFPFRLYCLT